MLSEVDLGIEIDFSLFECKRSIFDVYQLTL